VESCFAQKYDRLEVRVYEDAPDLSVEPQLTERFPTVRFTRSELQTGPTGLRDRGIREANGEIVFSLDDDAHFTDDRSVNKVARQFETDDRIGAIALPLVEPSRYPDGNGVRVPETAGTATQLRSFIGAGVAFRRRAFLEIGGVKDCYRYLGGDENDVAIRLIDRGYRIVLGQIGPVVHTVSPARDLSFKFRYDCRSALLFDYLNVPFPHVIPTLARHAIELFLYKLNRRTLGNRIASIAVAVSACLRFSHYRSPVSRKSYREYRRLPKQGILPANALGLAHCGPEFWECD
jgi:GT2 family glycosyltransferase